jgi:hypothetical protein
VIDVASSRAVACRTALFPQVAAVPFLGAAFVPPLSVEVGALRPALHADTHTQQGQQP